MGGRWPGWAAGLLGLLALSMLAAACGGAGGARDRAPREVRLPPAPRVATETALRDLARLFFEALARGDGAAVWDTLSAETQAALGRESVDRTALAVARALQAPAFVLDGITIVTQDDAHADFFVDGYFTNRGVRVGAEVDTRRSDPLRAVREGEGWRLAPPLTLFQIQATLQ